MADLEAIRQQLQAVRRHRLFYLVDWHHDVSTAGTVRVTYVDDEGKRTYPRITVDRGDTPGEDVVAADRAGSISGVRSLLVTTLQKILFGIEALGSQSVSGSYALISLEYHAENYFIRIASLLELLHRFVAKVLDPSVSDRDTVRQLHARIAAVEPQLADCLQDIREHVQQSKSRRNEVAHEAEFADERLAALRELIWSSIEYGVQDEPMQHDLVMLRRYQGEFLEEAVEEFSRLLSKLSCLFDAFMPLASEKLPASWDMLRPKRSEY